MLKRIFSLVNKHNKVELNFERPLFQFYKPYIGRGNNAQAIVNIFKLRWWWNVSVETQQIEDFREYNLIWTQWKKLRHFHFLELNQQRVEKRTAEDNERTNLSNELRIYAKLENNFHLSNKCALFYNMRRYYTALG